MWAIASRLLSAAIPVILGWFGYAPKGTVETTDEKLGKAEAENEGLRNYVDTTDRAAAARDSVSDDASSVRNDPDNQGPASR